MIGKSIVEGFRFAFSLKRMLPYIILNFLVLYAFCDMLGRAATIIDTSQQSIQPLTQFLGFYLFVFVACIILQPFLLGAMLHQARYFPKERPIMESFKFSLWKYIKTVATILILSLIYFLIGYIPYLWPFFLIFFTLAFFYVLPAAIPDERKISDSLKRSFGIFKKYSLQTFAVYVLALLVSLVLIVSSFIPLLFWLAGNVFNLISEGVTDENVLVQHFAELLTSPTIIPLELIPAVLSAFISVMNIGLSARLYFNLKRQRI